MIEWSRNGSMVHEVVGLGPLPGSVTRFLAKVLSYLH